VPEVRLHVPPGRTLHARPATSLARAAAAFRSALTVENLTNGRGPVNARSVISLLSLDAAAGAELRLCGDGEDADAAVAELSLIWSRLLEVEAQI